MSRKWLRGTIVQIEDCAPKTKRFWIEVQQDTPFHFEPGQFLTLDLPVGAKPKERWRSYSIASPPGDDNVVELVIVQLDGGAGTQYLFEEAGIGTELSFMGPLGKFTLPDNIEQDVCFICTGTGVAPFRSMLLDLYAKKIMTPDFYLIFGTRYVDDILYYDELEELNRKWTNFHYHVALSRDRSTEWHGHTGYVHKVYQDLFHDLRPADFYLCGWRAMINDAKEKIEEMGYPPSSIHREVYD